MNRYEQILPSTVQSHSNSDSRSNLARLKEFALSPGLPALKTVVTMVKEVSDVFPPLKTAANILLVVLERIDVRIQVFACSPKNLLALSPACPEGAWCHGGVKRRRTYSENCVWHCRIPQEKE